MKQPENPGSLSFIKEEHAKFLPEKTRHIIGSYRERLSAEAEVALAKWCEGLSSNRPFEEKLLALSRSEHAILRYIAAENLLELCSANDEKANEAGENFSKINVALLALEGTKKENDGKRLQLLIRLYGRAANIFFVLFKDPLTAIRCLSLSREYCGVLGMEVPLNIQSSIKTIAQTLIKKRSLSVYCYTGLTQDVAVFETDIVPFVTSLLAENPVLLDTPVLKVNYTCEQMVHYLYLLSQVFDIGSLLKSPKATKLGALLDKYKAHHEQFSFLPLGTLNTITREQFGECSLSGFAPYCYQLYTDVEKAKKLLELSGQLGIKQVSMRQVCEKYAMVYFMTDNVLVTLKQLEESNPTKIESLTIDGINNAASDESGQARKLKLDFTVQLKNPFGIPSQPYSCSILIPRELRSDLLQYTQNTAKDENPLLVKNTFRRDGAVLVNIYTINLVNAAFALLRITGLAEVNPEIYLIKENENEYYDLPLSYHAALRVLSKSYKSFEATQLQKQQLGTRGEFKPEHHDPAYSATKKLEVTVAARVAPIVASLNSVRDGVELDGEKGKFQAYESADGKICALLRCEHRSSATRFALLFENYRPAIKRHAKDNSCYIVIPDIETLNIKKCTI